MSKSVVISGPPAVGKTTVARALAAEFELEYVSGGDVLKELAVKEGYAGEGDDWWDTVPGMEFLKKRQGDAKFDRMVDERLVRMYDEGGRAITSYTLPWLVSGGVKIWLAGSHKSSASRMQCRDNMAVEDAMEITRMRYDENRALYKSLYGFDFGEDLSVFDAVIDTDRMDAAGVIAAAAKAAGRLL